MVVSLIVMLDVKLMLLVMIVLQEPLLNANMDVPLLIMFQQELDLILAQSVILDV